jgi:NADH-quinone oxidoreductase subunit J
MLASQDILFYILGFISVFCAAGVVLSQNPIYSALYLAASMISVAGIFVTLNAYFIAGVQIIVYAGAVTVLFVMVLMLFDLKHEMKTFSKGIVANIFKLLSSGLLCGMLVAFIWYSYSTEPYLKNMPADAAATNAITKNLAQVLFTKYLFGFEAIGVLLLIIAVGAVTLSRIQGGTHADS